jgi:hypothetical protein
MPNVTATTGANFIPEEWAAELSDAVQAWTGLAGLVDRSYEGEIKNAGDIVRIQDMTNPSVRFKTAGTSGSYDSTTETQDVLTINQHAYVGFLVEDFLEVQAKYSIRSEMTAKTTYSLMSVVEGDLTSGLAALPDNFSQNVGALGEDPVPEDIIRAVQYLDDADVPEGERFFYMSPGTHAALLKQDVFISGDYGQSGSVASGRVTTKVYGASPAVSTLASGNPSTAGQSYSWFCHKRGVALAMQRTPMIHTQWENLEIGWGVIADAIYGLTERDILPKTLDSASPNDNFNVSISGP